MPKHSEKKYLPYTPKELYSLVADIEKYPEFLPWCQDLKIISNNSNVVRAEMFIGFKIFRERFTTQVDLTDKQRITVKYLDGPFKYLHNYWIFEADSNNGCNIDFFVDFEFKSPLLQGMIGLIFTEALTKMIYAFENRAKEIYRGSYEP